MFRGKRSRSLADRQDRGRPKEEQPTEENARWKKKSESMNNLNKLGRNASIRGSRNKLGVSPRTSTGPSPRPRASDQPPSPSPASECPPPIIDRTQPEEAQVDSLEKAIDMIKVSIKQKQNLFVEFQEELNKMIKIFQDVVDYKNGAGLLQDLDKTDVARRSSDGPFTLVLHGLKADWIEEEMDDDPDFKRDVLEHRIKAMLKDEIGFQKEVQIKDVFRYKEGPRLNEAAPVIIEFKTRKEKDSVWRRAKDKVKKLDLILTEDSTTRTTGK